MASEVVRDQALMIELYNNQVAETEKLYLDVGYFMWMAFWDVIKTQNLVEKFMTANSQQDCQKLYDYFINVMNHYIRNTSGTTTTQNINNMIFNRNMITNSFNNNPMEFVNKMRCCLLQEKRVVDIYHGIAVDDNPVMNSDNGFSIMNGHGSLSVGSDFVTGDDLNLNGFAVSGIVINGDQEINKPLAGDNSDTTSIFNFQFLHDLESSFNKMRAQSMHKPQSIAYNDLQGLAGSQILPNNYLEDSRKAMSELKRVLSEYRNHQKLVENKLERECPQEVHLREGFNHYAEILADSYNIMAKPLIQSIIDDFMNMCLVVTQHPKGFILVQNDSKTQAKKVNKPGEEKDNASKEARQFNTKKKASISVAVDILGFKNLPNLSVQSCQVTLVTEDGQQCGELVVPQYTMNGSELLYTDITVHKYTRQANGNVRHQFVRLLIQVKLECFDQQFELTTKSLPFYLCTGAVQELELIGMRMWYCASNDDMYSPCRLKKELPANEVFDFLEKRLQCRCKERILSKEARQHLMSRLGKSGSTPLERQAITEKALVKDKLLKTDEKEKSFTLFTWFYAFVNSIETELSQYWRDGIIYDLMSSDDAEQLLLQDHIPLYTALLRPANQYVQKPNCIDAVIKLAVSIKFEAEDGVKIDTTAIKMKVIDRQGLKATLDNIQFEEGDSGIIRSILTKNGVRSLDCIKQCSNPSEVWIDEYGNTQTKAIFGIKLASKPSQNFPKKISRSSMEPVSPTMPKRKTCIRRLSNESSDMCASPDSLMLGSPPMPSPSSGYGTNVATPATMTNMSNPATPFDCNQSSMSSDAMDTMNGLGSLSFNENGSLSANENQSNFTDLLADGNMPISMNGNQPNLTQFSLERGSLMNCLPSNENTTSLQSTMNVNTSNIGAGTSTWPLMHPEYSQSPNLVITSNIDPNLAQQLQEFDRIEIEVVKNNSIV